MSDQEISALKRELSALEEKQNQVERNYVNEKREIRDTGDRNQTNTELLVQLIRKSAALETKFDQDCRQLHQQMTATKNKIQKLERKF
jgi:predicted  nucleic acid-binding Zn-ribbon protein